MEYHLLGVFPKLRSAGRMRDLRTRKHYVCGKLVGGTRVNFKGIKRCPFSWNTESIRRKMQISLKRQSKFGSCQTFQIMAFVLIPREMEFIEARGITIIKRGR